MRSGTPLGQVRGHGSAKHGPHHWWMQRVTAAANLLLVLWFMLSLARLPIVDHQAVVLWLKSPLVAVPLVLLVVSVCWHFRLGLQVVIEDYVHEGPKIAMTLLVTAYAVAIAALCLFSILKIAFGGVAA